MSGMTKQDYIIARLFEQEVVVVPSSRILKNLADVISDFTSELKSVGNSGEITQETSEAIAMLAHVVAGLNGDILPRKSDPLLSIGKDGIVATKHDDGEVR